MLSGNVVAAKSALTTPAYWLFIKPLTTDILPDKDVSQYISSKEKTGCVSATDKNGAIENTVWVALGGSATAVAVTYAPIGFFIWSAWFPLTIKGFVSPL